MDTVTDRLNKKRPYYIWDYNISGSEFLELLNGTRTFGRLDRNWAAVRLIEYAPYEEMIRLIGYRGLVRDWAKWRPRVRAHEQKRALDFLVDWISTHHSELINDESKPLPNK